MVQFPTDHTVVFDLVFNDNLALSIFILRSSTSNAKITERKDSEGKSAHLSLCYLYQSQLHFSRHICFKDLGNVDSGRNNASQIKENGSLKALQIRLRALDHTSGAVWQVERSYQASADSSKRLKKVSQSCQQLEPISMQIHPIIVEISHSKSQI